MWAFFALSSLAHPARAEPTLEVRAATRLRLEIEDVDRGREIHFALTDDLGAPLPARTLEVSVEGEAAFALETDDDGTARLAMRPGWNEKRLRVEVASTAHLDGTAREVVLGARGAPVELVPTLPGPGVVPLDEGVQFVRVHARSSAGGGGLFVRALDEEGRVLAEAETDSLGRATLGVHPRDLGPPGPGKLVFESDADETRGPGDVVVPITRTLKTALSLEPSSKSARPGRPLGFTGELTSVEGPLAARPVDLEVRGERVARTVTDGEGRFGFEYLFEEAGGPTLSARAVFAGGDDGAEPSESPTAHVAIRAPLPKWPFVLLPLAFAAAIAMARRSRLTPAEERRVRRPLRALFELPVRRVRLEIRDGRGRPVPGARATLDDEPLGVSDAAGQITTEELPQGAHRLRVEAEGFTREERALEIPAKAGGPVRITLLETREAATLALAGVARARGAPGDRIERSTHREIGAQIEIAPGELDSLVEHVDRAYYGRDSPGEDEIEEIRSRARDLEG